jgi:hypothetical protein
VGVEGGAAWGFVKNSVVCDLDSSSATLLAWLPDMRQVRPLAFT